MIWAKTKQSSGLLLRLALLLALTLPLLYIQPHASADTLTSRSVTIGDSKQGVATTNQFKFTIPSYATVGSIVFEYCDNTPFIDILCTAPAGLSASNASLTEQTGETGFSLDTPTANKITISRSPTGTTAVPVTYTFNDIVNPSDVNKTVYVRISTFDAPNGTGQRVDDGAVVFATSRNITVNGYVPPYLIFCVGVTVELNCSSASGSLLNFGELTTNQTRALTSQYSGSTNDAGGFTTTVIGPTMISGNNVIPAMTSQDVSRAGTGQFGMNLKANSNPGVGREPDGPGAAVPLGPVATPNRYYFANGVVSGSALPTDYTRFTASYIVNVGADQRPGVYSTTLTYVAVAAF